MHGRIGLGAIKNRGMVGPRRVVPISPGTILSTFPAQAACSYEFRFGMRVYFRANTGRISQNVKFMVMTAAIPSIAVVSEPGAARRFVANSCRGRLALFGIVLVGVSHFSMLAERSMSRVEVNCEPQQRLHWRHLPSRLKLNLAVHLLDPLRPIISPNVPASR